MSDVNAPERIAELEAQVAKLTQERDAAIREVAKWAQEAGSAEARLSQPASGSGVKALEWDEDESGWWSANPMYGLVYEILVTDRGAIRVRAPDKGGWEDFEGTTDEAKSRFQADFESRIKSALVEAPQPAPSVREYCTCNSKTNPCIVCGKPKFIDPEWLKRKLETDPDEGEIGAGFELFASPPSPAHGAVEALRETIRTRLLGIDPDSQDVVLEDDDWRLILAALAQTAAQEGWLPVAELLSTMKPGEQLDVLFGDPEWSWPILGIVTRFEDHLAWSDYDQQNDKYSEWPETSPPSIYQPVPKLPAAPSKG